MTQKYICPGCGKSYSTLDQVARCVQADSNAQKAREARAEQAKAAQAQANARKSVADARASLDEAYRVFSRAVAKYNETVEKAREVDPNGIYSSANVRMSYSANHRVTIGNKDKDFAEELNKLVKSLSDTLDNKERGCKCNKTSSCNRTGGDMESYLREIFGF